MSAALIITANTGRLTLTSASFTGRLHHRDDHARGVRPGVPRARGLDLLRAPHEGPVGVVGHGLAGVDQIIDRDKVKPRCKLVPEQHLGDGDKQRAEQQQRTEAEALEQMRRGEAADESTEEADRARLDSCLAYVAEGLRLTADALL